MRSLFKLTVVFLLINHSFWAQDQSPAVTPVEEHGQLSIQNGQIIDERSQPVQLKGMSLFWSQWQPQFYNEETVKNLAETWNIEIIRAAMAIEHGGYLEQPEKEMAKVKTVIDAAIGQGIYVIVDWHDHHAEEHLEEAKQFFEEIAERYKDVPNIIYEPYNEPLDVSWDSVLKPYHEQIITAIRQHDQNNIIVLGTPNWSQRVDLAAMNPIDGDNIAYTLHFYAGTHGQELREKAEVAIEKGLALFVTEYGTTNADGDGPVHKEATAEWYEFMDLHKLSWCNWSIAAKEESSAALEPGTAPQDLDKEEHITPSGKLVRALLLKE